ncbi:MAG: lipoprotein [Propylenella sp.]
MPVRSLIIVVLAAVAVSGCGRRGGLEAPGAVAEDTAQALPEDGISPLDPGSSVVGAPAEPQAAPPPRRRFFLDFLL